MSIAVLLGLPVISSACNVSLASETNETKTAITEQNQSTSEKEWEDVLDFMLNKATVYDEKGNVANLDFGAIAAKYGNSSELEQLEQIVKADVVERAKKKKRSAYVCARTAIINTVGWSQVKPLLKKGFANLLKKKMIKKLAKLLASSLVKKASPYIVTASLIYEFGKCMWF